MSADVERIYKESGLYKLDGVLRSGSKTKIEDAFALFRPEVAAYVTSSADFVSPDGKRGHALKPIRLVVGNFRTGSAYMPNKKTIDISIHSGVYRVISSCLDGVSVLACVRSMLPSNKVNRFLSEFDAAGIRGTIAHELSHWLDDALHSNNVDRFLSVARERSMKGGSDGSSARGQSQVEMDAQVHAIAEIKRIVGDEKFNDLSWSDLFRMKSSLIGNFKEYYGSRLNKDAYDSFMKRLLKRLARENLLSKKMTRPLNWAPFNDIYSNA